MQHCDSTCSHCAREFFHWLKARMAQMAAPRGKRAQRSGGGSFGEAAATSVRPERPAVGTQVRVKSFNYTHTATVVFNTGFRGLDGRHWVKVAVRTATNVEPWEVHVEREDLEETVYTEGDN